MHGKENIAIDYRSNNELLSTLASSTSFSQVFVLVKFFHALDRQLDDSVSNQKIKKEQEKLSQNSHHFSNLWKFVIVKL